MSRPFIKRNPDDPDPMLTTVETAKFLNVSVRAVQLWCNDGLLEYVVTPGGHRRIRRSSAARLIHGTGRHRTSASESDVAVAARLCAAARLASLNIVDLQHEPLAAVSITAGEKWIQVWMKLPS